MRPLPHRRHPVDNSQPEATKDHTTIVNAKDVGASWPIGVAGRWNAQICYYELNGWALYARIGTRDRATRDSTRDTLI